MVATTWWIVSSCVLCCSVYEEGRCGSDGKGKVHKTKLRDLPPARAIKDPLVIHILRMLTFWKEGNFVMVGMSCIQMPAFAF